MDERLKYHEIVYIENEFPNNERAICGAWVLYDQLLKRGIINSFEEFVGKWDIMLKTRLNFSKGNFEVGT